MGDLGVVAIGRNEGPRLKRCLESVAGRAAVVYVDSASTDDSLAIARSVGVEVVELDMSVPFTAARARNEGFRRLRELTPALRFVQFVDGDCEVCPGWLQAARAQLESRPDVAVVCGRRRERYPESSVYNRLCDVEWDTPVGEAKSCGGDALMRADVVHAVGGYDPGVIAAEDDELCLRIRRAGWTVLRIDAPMTVHDAAMTRASQWWKRAVRCGFAYACGASLHGRGPERHFVRERRRAVVWGIGVPAVSLLAAWSTGGLSLLLLAAYPLQLARTYRGLRRRVPRRRLALEYATSCVLSKFPEALGVLRFLARRVRGGSARIIEYK